MTAKNMKIKSKNLPHRTLPKNGDINLTELFKKAGKQLSHFFDNKDNKVKILEDISQETKIPLEELIYRVTINGKYNVWINKILIIRMEIEEWANKANKIRLKKKYESD
jgi:hypothetical protein